MLQHTLRRFGAAFLLRPSATNPNYRACFKATSSLHTDTPLPKTPSPPFPNEYENAAIITNSIPGPKSQTLKEKLDDVQQTGAIHFFVDYKKSRGNYIVDADGNRYLDALGQIASLPIGYNHPRIVEAMTDPRVVPLLVQRPCLGMLPPDDWTELIDSALMRIAPRGLTEVHTMMCGACSNENAFKCAFIWYQTKQRGGEPPTEYDLDSCMMNQAPGSPNISVLAFKGAFHGRLLGCMSTTRSKAIHKVDVPAFDWPMVDFPMLRYPLDKFQEENAREEARCLAQVREAIQEYKTKSPVAAILVEPIQSEGGDNHASKDFFRSLRQIATECDVAFIVDEVQTGGGATGTFWAHEQWELESPPDIVTFSKKMQTGGYYTTKEFRPKESYRVFNTWMGDPAKLIQLKAFVDAVEQDRLLENVEITGKYLLDGLENLQQKYPNLLSRARGVGTFCAIDFPSAEQRDKAVGLLRQYGAECAGSGDVTLRFRPSLIFQPRHVAELLGYLDRACGQL